MRAIVIHKAGDLRLDMQPEPDAPGPGEVAIQLSRGGICGSDLHYFNHGGFGAIRLKEPMILGHEVAGKVIALGAGVDHLAIGQPVAVSPSRPSGHCAYCAEGLPNHCENMAFYGSAMPFPHIQGAFRDILVAKVSQCVPTDGLTMSEAAMTEPLSVALHAVGRAGPVLGRSVLVTGCGPIGLLVIAALRAAGAGKITATDLGGFPLDAAMDLGADEGLDVSRTPGALDRYAAGKGHFDLMFECSGSPAALAGGISAMRPRGIVIQLGLGGDMPVPMGALTAKELDLRGAFRFHAEFAKAVEMMRTGRIRVAPLLTHSFQVEDAETAFATANDRSVALKVQLDFEGL